MEEGKRVAKVAIIMGDKVLMGKRRDSGKWTEPGGHLEPGEKPLDGIIRETKEEAGLHLSPRHLTLLKTKRVTMPNGKPLTVYAYKAWLPERLSTSMKNDPDQEVQKWHLVSMKGGLPKHIRDNLHVPVGRNVVYEAMGYDKKEPFWKGFSKAASLTGSIFSHQFS